MKIDSCVWCGCPVQGDDVCIQHFNDYGNLRRGIARQLNAEHQARRHKQWQMVEFTRRVNKLVAQQLDVEKLERAKIQEGNGLMSDYQQQQIFRALGIAV